MTRTAVWIAMDPAKHCVEERKEIAQAAISSPFAKDLRGISIVWSFSHSESCAKK